MLRLDWFRITQTGALIAALCVGIGCGGGGDDGDGGSLSAREEQAVQEWFVAFAEAGQAMEEIPMEPGAGAEVFAQARAGIERLMDMEPPRISNNEANQAFQDFHGGMSTMMETMLEMVDGMSSAGNDMEAMARIMTQMAGIETAMRESEQQVASAVGRISQIIAVDFGDNAEALAQMRGLLSEMPGGESISTTPPAGTVNPGAATFGK